MDSIMFVDDQPFELDEVKSEHPEITCVHASEYMDLPANPRLNPEFITEESKRRRLMYIEEQKRQVGESNFQGPRKEFLASLDIHLRISKVKEPDLRRAEELTVRTNQFNTTARRRSGARPAGQ